MCISCLLKVPIFWKYLETPNTLFAIKTVQNHEFQSKTIKVVIFERKTLMRVIDW